MGIGIGNRGLSEVRIELKRWDGSYAGSISYTKPEKKKYKRLSYNFKAMSSLIMRARTSGGARQAASRIRRQTVLLQMNLMSDDYDQEDLIRAINHSKSLERVAKKRMKHLTQEEMIKRKSKAALSEDVEIPEEDVSECTDPEDMMKMSEEELEKMMREFEDAMKELEEQTRLQRMDAESLDVENSPEYSEEENLYDYISDEADAMDLEKLKKKHRSEELRDIMEADLRYLRALFNKLAREKQNASNASGSSGGSNGSEGTGNAGHSGVSAGGSAQNTAGGVSLELAGLEMAVEPTAAPVSEGGAFMDISV